jgi:phosphatidylglycerol:prolipoprotein diacylglycerol transferase
MFDFLHTFQPEAVFLAFGPIKIYWYGLFIVLGTVAALTVAMKLAQKQKFPTDKLFDLAFWLILFGIIGARIYHIFLEWPYYSKFPLDMIKIWQGGLAIHGGLIAGLIVLILFCRKEKVSFWFLGALIVPGVALGQAIGRWGNYFNQELYGKPTDLPWGLPVDLMHRPMQYLSSEYFHPTFLYESLGNLIIFGIVLFLALKVANKKIQNEKVVLLSYLALYSILRFSTEFIRVDSTALVLGFRWPQIISVAIFAISIIWLITSFRSKKNTTTKPS